MDLLKWLVIKGYKVYLYKDIWLMDIPLQQIGMFNRLEPHLSASKGKLMID